MQTLLLILFCRCQPLFCTTLSHSIKKKGIEKYMLIVFLGVILFFGSKQNYRADIAQGLHRLEKYLNIQDLKSPWKFNLPWKVLEKHSEALKSPWILPFTGGFNTVFGDLNQYKIVVPLFNYLLLYKSLKIYKNSFFRKKATFEWHWIEAWRRSASEHDNKSLIWLSNSSLNHPMMFEMLTNW